MKALKEKLYAKGKGKAEREIDVLIGLIDAYLESGKPVSSDSLKTAKFDHISSATIRNYFAKLEEEGYLHQPHTSGGRIPTEKAFSFYAKTFLDQGVIESDVLSEVDEIKALEAKEIPLLIQKTEAVLSRLSELPVFISYPRFDQDFISEIKIVPIDRGRILALVMTDFGQVHTELFQNDGKISNHSAKRIEAFLNARLTRSSPTYALDAEEEAFALHLYHEVAVRFLVGYQNYAEEDLSFSGLARILKFQEFRDPATLSDSLSLFENRKGLRHLLKDTEARGALRAYVGEELLPFGAKSKEIAAIAIPYRIHSEIVGAFGVMGPTRIPYRTLFGLLQATSLALSSAITKSVYKFKLTFRQPEAFHLLSEKERTPRIEQKPLHLIEEKKGKKP